MKAEFINKLGTGSGGLALDKTMLQGHVTKTAGMDGGPSSFKSVMFNTLNNVNAITAQPDQMMQEAITNGTYDVHDVMLASAKAELTVSMTAQVATKVIQAYDKILQIQV